MDEKKYYDSDTYQTGRTRAPRRRNGLMAIFLSALIFAGGVFTAAKLLNRQTDSKNPEPEEGQLSFYQETEDSSQTEDTQTDRSDNWDMVINSAPQSVENVPQSGGLSLQQIYEKNIPSVVSITCTMSGGGSTGTGVVLSGDGYIVTNCHVVSGARQIQVLLSDGRTLPAQIAGEDELSDLAVLVVQATDLQPAEFGDSASLRVGDAVAAIGDPLGVELRGTMTNGIVSAINRDVTTGGRIMTLIQTNAALNSGNSGGPLLNCYGQVVGINAMKMGDYMSSAGVEGLGFAIPSATVEEVVEQLLRQGYVSGRPGLGFEGETVSVFQQIYARLPQGVYITQVDMDSDSARQGICPGDVLVAVDSQRITTEEALMQILNSYQPGDAVQVVIYRSGNQYALNLTVGEMG